MPHKITRIVYSVFKYDGNTGCKRKLRKLTLSLFCLQCDRQYNFIISGNILQVLLNLFGFFLLNCKATSINRTIISLYIQALRALITGTKQTSGT